MWWDTKDDINTGWMLQIVPMMHNIWIKQNLISQSGPARWMLWWPFWKKLCTHQTWSDFEKNAIWILSCFLDFHEPIYFILSTALEQCCKRKWRYFAFSKWHVTTWECGRRDDLQLPNDPKKEEYSTQFRIWKIKILISVEIPRGMFQIRKMRCPSKSEIDMDNHISLLVWKVLGFSHATPKFLW